MLEFLLVIAVVYCGDSNIRWLDMSVFGNNTCGNSCNSPVIYPMFPILNGDDIMPIQ